jgi:hypothetical protein
MYLHVLNFGTRWKLVSGYRHPTVALPGWEVAPGDHLRDGCVERRADLDALKRQIFFPCRSFIPYPGHCSD